MSKRLPARVNCPHCGQAFDVELFRSLWVEDPENRRLVTDDGVNAVTCPHCKTTTRLEFPFLCTNVRRRIAIWYEPYHDSAVDEDVKQYAKHFGQSSFYAVAPRVRDWKEFKAKLMELETFSDEQCPLPPASPEMAAAMSSFIGSLRSDYPGWLIHLRNPALRLLYAGIPFAALVSFAAWNHHNSFQEWLTRFGGESFWIFVIGVTLTFGLLTGVHALAPRLKPWRQPSKTVRVLCFWAACWVILGLTILVVFDPLGYESIDYMEASEFRQAIFIVLGVPTFAAIGTFFYTRFVK